MAEGPRISIGAPGSLPDAVSAVAALPDVGLDHGAALWAAATAAAAQGAGIAGVAQAPAVSTFLPLSSAGLHDPLVVGAARVDGASSASPSQAASQVPWFEDTSAGAAAADAGPLPSWLEELASVDAVGDMLESGGLLSFTRPEPTIARLGPRPGPSRRPLDGGGLGAMDALGTRVDEDGSRRSLRPRGQKRKRWPGDPFGDPFGDVEADPEAGRATVAVPAGPTKQQALGRCGGRRSGKFGRAASARTRRQTKRPAMVVVPTLSGASDGEHDVGSEGEDGGNEGNNSGDPDFVMPSSDDEEEESGSGDQGDDDGDDEFLPASHKRRRPKAKPRRPSSKGKGKGKGKAKQSSRAAVKVPGQKRNINPTLIRRTCAGDLAESKRDLKHADWNLYLLGMQTTEYNIFFSNSLAAWRQQEMAKETKRKGKQKAEGKSADEPQPEGEAAGTAFARPRPASKKKESVDIRPFVKAHREDYAVYRRKLKNRMYQVRALWQKEKHNPGKQKKKNSRRAMEDPAVVPLLQSIDKLRQQVGDKRRETRALVKKLRTIHYGDDGEASEEEEEGFEGDEKESKRDQREEQREQQADKFEPWASVWKEKRKEYLVERHLEILNTMKKNKWWERFQPA